MSRWFWRAVCAAAVTALLAYAITPPKYVQEQLSVNPERIIGQMAGVLATSFVLVSLGDIILAWSIPRLRTMRRSALISFASGVLAAIFALSWWFAALAVLVAPIGIVAGLIALRKEAVNHERHNRLSLIGLALSFLAPSVFVWQVMITIGLNSHTS